MLRTYADVDVHIQYSIYFWLKKKSDPTMKKLCMHTTREIYGAV